MWLPFCVGAPVTGQVWIALLAAIGPSTHGKMSMADLRNACETVGFSDVRTVLATGNVIFSSDKSRTDIQLLFEQIVTDHDLSIGVFLRRPHDLVAVRDTNPFPDAAVERPQHLLVHFLAELASAAALDDYQGPERIGIIGHEVYIDYRDGVGTSKLTGSRLKRGLGQSGTARNWNTINKLIDRSG